MANVQLRPYYLFSEQVRDWISLRNKFKVHLGSSVCVIQSWACLPITDFLFTEVDQGRQRHPPVGEPRYVGVSPRLLRLFASLLRNRMQYVRYGPYSPVPYFIDSSVSQGFTLGPLPFTILINNLASSPIPRVIRYINGIITDDPDSDVY
jgi:hypothetical protein